MQPALSIFFDVDGTLVTSNHRLRPWAREVFERLHGRGHHIYLWSGYGARHEIARRHDLQPLLSGLFGKPLYDYEARRSLFTDVRPDFIVDDHPEIVEALGGACVEPALEPFDGDREMVRVYREILRFDRSRGT